MPKVKVVVTNEQTGLTRETTTNDDGDYVVPLLPVGSYVVTAEQAGFKLAVRSDVRLNVDQVQRIDLQLDAGNVTETVEVRSAAVALDTASASIGHNITEKQVTELPLNGRNFLQLLFLGAGAVETERRAGRRCGRASATPSASWARGRRRTTTCSTARRTPTPRSARRPPSSRSTPSRSSRSRRRPTRRSTASARTRSTSSASRARTSSTGTGFGFFRNERLDARNFFDPARRREAQARSEAVRVRRRRPRAAAVLRRPQQDVLPGQLRRHAHRARVQLVLHRARRRSSSRAGSRRPSSIPLTGQPFPNNTIPASRFSRLAQLALRNNWYPAPNISAAQGNYQLVRTLPQNADQFTHSRRSGSRRSLGRVVRPLHQVDVRQPHQLEPAGHRRSRLRAGHDQLAGLAHAAVPQQPREPVPRRPRRGAGRPGAASRARRRTSTSCG